MVDKGAKRKEIAKQYTLQENAKIKRLRVITK